jgi:hypothetical protein
MMTFLEFTFRSFWHFIGVLILLSAMANLILKSWESFWKHRTINKHGYPPAHYDMDGTKPTIDSDDF